MTTNEMTIPRSLPPVSAVLGDPSGGSPIAIAASEVAELFAPVLEWRRLAPVERTFDAYSLVLDVPLTLACWGWGVETSLGPQGFMVRATKSLQEGVRMSGRSTGTDLADALFHLHAALTRDIARLRDRHELRGAA
ncbi:MAG: hypothetical protein WBA63_04860 [Thermomicrobiales bacterium]